MATELVLLGTAGAPLPVPGRAGISSALVVGERIFVIDCGRGSPSAYADAGLEFSRLDAVFLTHLHADHAGDLAGMLLYGWGVRNSVAPIRVFGPSRPRALPPGEGPFRRQTTIHPELAAPGTADLVGHLMAGYAYHLNIMPLDCRMPDPAGLVRAADVDVPASAERGGPELPVTVLEDDDVKVRAVAVTHGHAIPALAYRFDTAEGSVVFSGDTTVNENLIGLARGADILVHQVADLGYFERHGCTGGALERMAESLTDVTEAGGVAERAGVGELILSHYLPPEPSAISAADWEARAGQGFGGRTTAGQDGMRRRLAGATWS